MTSGSPGRRGLRITATCLTIRLSGSLEIDTKGEGQNMELKSRRHTVSDIGGAIELCYTNGWTDGLPVVPPTAERIEAMLEAGGLEPQHQLAFIENRQVSVTAEKVAIN